MKIRAGFDIAFDCPAPTPLILLLGVEAAREADLETPQKIRFDPPVEHRSYRDMFGNACTRVVAPGGVFRMSADFVIRDSGEPDPIVPDAEQIPVEKLPDETLVYLLGSRYCDTEHLADAAWSLFSATPPGWARVQAICDYVHQRLTFGYSHARATRTAAEGHAEQRGVCRDFAHLAITFCRCMNIPARYCTGYLGDIGVPIDPNPMDFSAWFEAYLGGRWYTFDARHNVPRIGRIVMARGRDATDVAISTAFGRADLHTFKVITEEVG
ncbi:Transglutaminase [Rhodovulum sp. PH10]|uniref:transglutaminase-like domain-containing protein n=1 Tax=Rhodovulum sp. PH10 TaxID=1187851 RepID=UPI00027C20F3|nr:transglutaminase family protein [Rhodovulum sp. PH10]EJW09513.1 Transglutaminase [Rhodovulum sp. PH10]